MSLARHRRCLLFLTVPCLKHPGHEHHTGFYPPSLHCTVYAITTHCDMDEEDVATCHWAEEAVSSFLVTLCLNSLLSTGGRFQPEVTQVKSHSCDGNQMLPHNTLKAFSPLNGSIALKGKELSLNLHGWIKVSLWHNMAAVAVLWGECPLPVTATVKPEGGKVLSEE